MPGAHAGAPLRFPVALKVLMKVFTLFAGVDGVGKTSLLGVVRAERRDLGLIFTGAAPDMPRLERALADGVDCTLETTLCDEVPVQLCRRAKDAGYCVRLYYIGLDTAEEGLLRLARRADSVPAQAVRARFACRFDHAAEVLSCCDEALFYDNYNGFVPVAEYRGGQLLPLGGKQPAWLRELMALV